MEHQANVPVQTTNKFALLEEGKVGDKQIKKETVLNVVNKENAKKIR